MSPPPPGRPVQHCISPIQGEDKILGAPFATTSLDRPSVDICRMILGHLCTTSSTASSFSAEPRVSYAPCLSRNFKFEADALLPLICEPGRAAASASSATALDLVLNLMIFRGRCEGSADDRDTPGDTMWGGCVENVWLDCEWDRGPAEGRAGGDIELPGFEPEGSGFRIFPLGNGVFC